MSELSTVTRLRWVWLPASLSYADPFATISCDPGRTKHIPHLTGHSAPHAHHEHLLHTLHTHTPPHRPHARAHTPHIHLTQDTDTQTQIMLPRLIHTDLGIFWSFLASILLLSAHHCLKPYSSNALTGKYQHTVLSSIFPTPPLAPLCWDRSELTADERL